MDSPWSHSEVVEFYTGHRCRREDLYETERSLLEPILPGMRSVLDFGCAAGGFFPILRALRPGIRYTGADRSGGMIRKARVLHPVGEFRKANGLPLPFKSRSFDLALATGVLHHNPNYLGLIRELYRVCAVGCLLDLPRLAVDPWIPSRAFTQSLEREFSINRRAGQASARVPYLVVPPRPLFQFLLNTLVPRPRALAAVGRIGPPSPAASVPARRVCFCVIYLAKGKPGAGRKADLWLDLPGKVVREAGLKAQTQRLRNSSSLDAFLEAIR